MKVEAKKTGSWQHTLTIELPADELERRLEEVARGIQRRAQMPGFRKGKTPLAMVRQNFAEVIEQEFLENHLGRLTGEAVDRVELKPIVPPLVRDLKLTPGKPLTFDAVVEVRPEVHVTDYRGLEITREARPVSDEAVDQVIERLREDSAVFEDLDRPAERGDVVLFDSTRLDANGRRLSGSRAKGRRVELGARDLIPDLENGLLGAVAGQERTLEIHYPEEYPVPELAGQKARYIVHIRKIQEKKLRPCDDTWARDVFKLETVEALRSRVRENLESEEKARVRREMETAVATALIQRNSFELPDRLVQWMLDRVIADAAEGREVSKELRKELETRYRPGVEHSLRREFLLDAVARQEKREVSDDEVVAEIDRMTEADPRQAARVRAHYRSAERREGLKDRLREKKALDWLIEAANIRDGAGETKRLILPASR